MLKALNRRRGRKHMSLYGTDLVNTHNTSDLIYQIHTLIQHGRLVVEWLNPNKTPVSDDESSSTLSESVLAIKIESHQMTIRERECINVHKHGFS